MCILYIVDLGQFNCLNKKKFVLHKHLREWMKHEFGTKISQIIGEAGFCSDRACGSGRSECLRSKETTTDEASSGGKVKATTTIGMITDIVKNVGGEHVEVTGIMKAGVDPHLYKASEGDIGKLDQAQIIFYNGLHLEGKMVEIFEKMAKDKPTVAVSKNIPVSKLRAGDPEQGTEHDPHIWFNVRHWMTAAETVRDELVKFDPAHADAYKKNTEEYLAKLKELDAYAKEQIASIPEGQRVLVTAHDAFGYFGDAIRSK